MSLHALVLNFRLIAGRIDGQLMDGVKKDFNHEQSLANHEGPPHIKAMCNYEGNMRDLLMHVKASIYII